MTDSISWSYTKSSSCDYDDIDTYRSISNWVHKLPVVSTVSVKTLQDQNAISVYEYTDRKFKKISSTLPKWGSIWFFADPHDEKWLKSNGKDIMTQLGFKVLRIGKTICFGIDREEGNFYKEFWFPLWNVVHKK